MLIITLKHRQLSEIYTKNIEKNSRDQKIGI